MGLSKRYAIPITKYIKKLAAENIAMSASFRAVEALAKTSSPRSNSATTVVEKDETCSNALIFSSGIGVATLVGGLD